jgi:virginiamycin B lyase
MVNKPCGPLALATSGRPCYSNDLLNRENWKLYTVGNNLGNIFRFNGSSFEQVPGFLTEISVGATLAVWGINASNEVYRYNGSSFQKVPGAVLRSIAVGTEGLVVWGISPSNEVYWYNIDSSSQFNKVPSAVLQSIAVGIDGTVWGINDSNEIYRFNSSSSRFDKMPGPPLTQIAVGSATAVWGISDLNEVYQYNRSSFQKVPGGGTREYRRWVRRDSLGDKRLE